MAAENPATVIILAVFHQPQHVFSRTRVSAVNCREIRILGLQETQTERRTVRDYVSLIAAVHDASTLNFVKYVYTFHAGEFRNWISTFARAANFACSRIIANRYAKQYQTRKVKTLSFEFWNPEWNLEMDLSFPLVD